MTLPEPFQNALILTGPTASGKTALALELAEQLDAEIIAMDSMTLYRGMDIGTAKPTVDERAAVPHHLIDVLDPWESANVAWWLDEAARCCREVESRGKLPLFVGGTPFYLKALLHGLFDSPAADQELRRQLEAEALRIGPTEFHSLLAGVDPASAARLHPNDTRRIVRALEVWHLTGKPISEWQQQRWWTVSPPNEAADPQRDVDAPACRCIAIELPREELYARINRRVEYMMESGWIEEVQRLRSMPRPLSKEASQALGYREVSDYLEGKRNLDETIVEIQMRSRQFAKRQLTWFRGLKECRRVEGKLTFDLWREKMS